jgi:gliding motility-associated protein GldC
MHQSSINIDVTLDAARVPEDIRWNASENNASTPNKAKAMMLSFWDGSDHTALRMDLWTKEMRVDEMADFYFQTMMTMADSFERATHQKELVEEMKKFATDFYKKFQEHHIKENKI